MLWAEAVTIMTTTDMSFGPLPSDLFERACRAYAAHANPNGHIIEIPSSYDSDLVKWRGHEYVVLRNINGVRAVFRIH